MTTVIGGLNPLDDITITNEKSVLPFKFKVIYPNEILKHSYQQKEQKVYR